MGRNRDVDGGWVCDQFVDAGQVPERGLPGNDGGDPDVWTLQRNDLTDCAQKAAPTASGLACDQDMVPRAQRKPDGREIGPRRGGRSLITPTDQRRYVAFAPGRPQRDGDPQSQDPCMLWIRRPRDDVAQNFGCCAEGESRCVRCRLAVCERRLRQL